MTEPPASGFNCVPYSPYFTLTTTWYLHPHRGKLGDPPVPESPTPPQRKHKPETFSVQEIFGRARDMSDDDQAQFLLLLMKHVDVDWSVATEEAAKACKIPGIAQMRARFVSIAKKHQFSLEDGKKITGGLLFNKSLLGPPKTPASGSNTLKAESKKPPKAPRKRKKKNSSPNPSATKKGKTTGDTPNLDGPTQAPVPIYMSAQEAEGQHEDEENTMVS